MNNHSIASAARVCLFSRPSALARGRASASLGFLLLAVSLGWGCAGLKNPDATAQEIPALVGPVDRQQIETHDPEWVAAQIEAQVDDEAAAALLRAGGEAEVTVFLGTWCSDSRRELARLWRAFDSQLDEPAFDLEYVGVDRDKLEPVERLDGIGLLYVPTFIVRVGGHEVGRIVEESPNGIEVDLLSLLSGSQKGLITAKAELLENVTTPLADGEDGP